MRRVLVIQTEKDNNLTTELIRLQSATPGHEVSVADLTVPEPDYAALLHQIFKSDSVQVY